MHTDTRLKKTTGFGGRRIFAQSKNALKGKNMENTLLLKYKNLTSNTLFTFNFTSVELKDGV